MSTMKDLIHRVVFLDIDGVLNEIRSTSRCCGFIGIDNSKAQTLSTIINNDVFEIEPLVVLTSTWKSDWERVECLEDLSKCGQYLVKHLHRCGIHIFDKTEDVYEETKNRRGQSILNWLEKVKQDGVKIESFVILDDEMFDYEELGLTDRLVKTSFYDTPGGLQESDVPKTIEILKRPIELYTERKI